MKHFKTWMACLLLGGMTMQSAQAQKEGKKEYPYAFIGVQGGLQSTFTNFTFSNIETPIFAGSVGAMWTPVVGTRVHVSAMNCKGAIKELNETYGYKFVTSDLDLMINLKRIFAPYNEQDINVYLIGGVGLTYAWDNEKVNALAQSSGNCSYSLAWDDDRLVHNFRVGAQFEAALSRVVGLNLEVTANNLSDRFNSKINGKGDWQLQALIGLNFKIGRPGKAKATSGNAIAMQDYNANRNADAVAANKQDPSATPKPDPKPVVTPPAPKKLAETKCEIFFDINSSAVRASEEAKLQAFAEWMKQHPSAKAEIMGYADAGTGNPNINRNISQKRADRVAKVLVERYGISADRLTTGYKGDSVQPFKDNDSNRVVIGVAKETK